MLFTIPDDLPGNPHSRTLQVGGYCCAEYHQTITQEPRNIFISQHTLIFVKAGAKVFRFPDREVTVPAGRAIFLQRGCYLLCESLGRGQQYESLSFFFNDEALRQFWWDLPRTRRAPPRSQAKVAVGPMLELPISPELEHFRSAIAGCFQRQAPYQEQLLRLKMQELILLLLASPVGSRLAEFFDAIYAQTRIDPVHITQMHLLKPLGLRDFAALAGRSLSAYKRAFLEATGTSPGKWIQERRLEHARLRLRACDLTVAAVGAESGFENTSHFIRAYRQCFGVTPATDRNR